VVNKPPVFEVNREKRTWKERYTRGLGKEKKREVLLAPTVLCDCGAPVLLERF